MGLSKDAAISIFRIGRCPHCLETGYRGRIGIFEFLRMTEAIKTLTLQTSDSNQIRRVGVEQGMLTLRDDGIRKVLEGITTVSEVLRVTQI
jgi:general secretion pathway protein E